MAKDRPFIWSSFQVGALSRNHLDLPFLSCSTYASGYNGYHYINEEVEAERNE
jgi:hypothetical protein